MRFAIMLEPQQGITYARAARRRPARRGGRLRGVLPVGSLPELPRSGRPADDRCLDRPGRDRPRDDRTIRLGALVSPVTYRLPGPFAKIVTTVDEMSGGRVEVGVGAGWHEQEHARMGIPFPPIGERAEIDSRRPSRSSADCGRSRTAGRTTGRLWTVVDAMFRPKPVQRPHPPIIVGGSGTPRGVRIAARYADEFNMTKTDPAAIASWYAGARRSLPGDRPRPGLDPPLGDDRSPVGAATRPSWLRRKAAILDSFAIPEEGEAWFARREPTWIIGTPDQARRRVAELAALGVERLMLQDFVPRDLAMIDLLGREVVAAG